MLKAILLWVISNAPLNKRHKIQKRQIKNGQSREIGNIRQTRHRTKTKHKQNIICVGHHHTQDTRQRQTKQKTEHNMCWTPPYTRHKTKTNKTKNSTQKTKEINNTVHPHPPTTP
jgi:hypothetical protein